MKKRKIRSTMSVFLTTFLLLQIILLFLYKSFIVDIAKKNEKNLVENTLQIYHNTMESVLERLDDNLDLLLGCRLLLTQLNGENNLEKVKAQHQMLQILKERCKDTKEADAYAIVNCKDNSILIQRNGNITYDMEMEIMPDHVHILMEVAPQFGIHKAVKSLKGYTSKVLRSEYPSLKTKIPSLWTNSYFVSTVGGAPLDVIKQYIENQKTSQRQKDKLG